MKDEDYITIYAIIPSYIYKTKDLTSEEKLIAERITALCKKEGKSWITNKRLANMYGIREDTVSNNIKKLKDIGFIKCLYDKETNTKSKRVIYLTDKIWDKYASSYSPNNQNEVGYIAGHNNKNKYKNDNKRKSSIPKWMEDPSLCQSQKATPEEQAEMQRIIDEMIGRESDE